MFAVASLLAISTPVRKARAWNRPSELRVAPPPPQLDVEALLDRALSYLGQPYALGGVGSPAFDCSGFVCRVYAEQGWALPRVSRDQARAGQPVALDALAPGDLLFFAERAGRISHVGIFLGNDTLVHASSGRGEVVVAKLSSRWFSSRLVGARRVLTEASWTPVEVTEVVEHRGATALLPFVDRPPRLASPALGFELGASEGTGLGIRLLGVSEDGKGTALVVPEGHLVHRPLGLTVVLGVPLSINANGVSLGPLERFADATRFLRRARIGLAGARFEAALEREGGFGLVGTQLVHDLTPSLASEGLPGLSPRRSPLTASVATRPGKWSFEGLVDDVVEPGVFGFGVGWRLREPMSLRLVAAGDLRGEAPRPPDPVSGLSSSPRQTFVGAAALGVEAAIRKRRYALGVRAEGQVLGALEQFGAGVRAAAFGHLRLRDARRTELGLEAGGGLSGSHFIDGWFGPTYAASRQEHVEVLSEVGSIRGLVYGQFVLRRRTLALRLGYGQGLGSGAVDFDRRVEAGVELRGLSLGRGRVLELRGGYAGRGLGAAPEVHVGAFGARIRWTSWLSTEALAQAGETFSVGGGLTVTWVP
ncbi:MAG: C40 family peptidase, partial [Myxococcota bacterium]